MGIKNMLVIVRNVCVFDRFRTIEALFIIEGVPLPKVSQQIFLEKCKIRGYFVLENCRIHPLFTLEKCKMTEQIGNMA